jgi:hypothetical protein
MKILIRAAYMVLSLTVGIPPVANAGSLNDAPTPTQQDNTANWVNG